MAAAEAAEAKYVEETRGANLIGMPHARLMKSRAPRHINAGGRIGRSASM